MFQFTFEAIGTRWQIDIYEALLPDREVALLVNIRERIDRFDQTYSRFREDSLVTKMSKEPGVYDLPDDAGLMIHLYFDLYKRTHGLMTPLIGNLIATAGYDANYTLKQHGELEKPLPWEEAIEYKDGKLIVKKPVLLDFGAAGKGYLIDLVTRVLDEGGIYAYCIDAGGDILKKGGGALRVGLENPSNTKEVIGVVTLENGSLCGSAGNRRVWDKFTHIMNPETLESQKNILAVWVYAKNAILADALATALFFVGTEVLRDYEFEYALVRDDYSLEKSKGFNAEFFIADTMSS